MKFLQSASMLPKNFWLVQSPAKVKLGTGVACTRAKNWQADDSARACSRKQGPEKAGTCCVLGLQRRRCVVPALERSPTARLHKFSDKKCNAGCSVVNAALLTLTKRRQNQLLMQ